MNKKKKYYFNKLTPKTFWNTIFPGKQRRWVYMGYGYNLFREGTEGYEYIDTFFEYVDSQMRSKWCPKTVLRLLHLVGNDNSIVRVRWWWAHKLHRKLAKGILINDVKEKYGTLRIYGYFTNEIYEELKKLEKKVDPLLKV